MGLILILISNIIGYFKVPFSIIITPIILPLIIGGINSSFYKMNYYLAVFYGFMLLLLNDKLIRLYGEGTLNEEQTGWIGLFFIIAFCICILIMMVFAFKINKADTTKKNGLIILTKITFILNLATLTGLFYFNNYIHKI